MPPIERDLHFPIPTSDANFGTAPCHIDHHPLEKYNSNSSLSTLEKDHEQVWGKSHGVLCEK